MNRLGKQYVIILEECSEQLVADPEAVIACTLDASKTAGLHILDTLEHRFTPQGLTYILLLSQSHLVVHTWPEYNTLVLDLFVCSDGFNFDGFVELVKTMSQAQKVNKIVVF